MADNRLYTFYHSESSGIALRCYEGGKWGKPSVVAEGAQDNFTVSCDRHGTLYLFAQDAEGDVHLHRLHNGEWKSRLMLKNPGDRQAKLHIYPMVSDGKLSILYNSTGGADSGSLIMRGMDEFGKWQPPHTVDTYAPGLLPFSVQMLTPEHALVLYAKSGSESCVGYVEAGPNRTTDFNEVYSTAGRIADTSFLATDNSLHALMVVKNQFMNQIVYRRKDDAGFAEAVVLAEGQQLGNCMLMYITNVLTAFFMSGGSLVFSSSDDHGRTFSAPVRYTNKLCAAPVKAAYISQIPMDTRAYYLRQLYVDRNNAADIQLLPDMYEDFFPAAAAPPAVAPRQQANTEELTGKIIYYRDKLEVAEMLLAEKEKQMAKFMHAAGEERAKFAQRVKALEAEVDALSQSAAQERRPALRYPLMIVSQKHENAECQ